MRYTKYEKLYRCVMIGAIKHCLFGLEFSDTKQPQVDFIIHHHNVGKPEITDSNDVLMQVMNAVQEKEQEYQQLFYVKTIEFVDNDIIPHSDVYYDYTKKIIDRIIGFPEYESEG